MIKMAERILRGWITHDDKMVQRIKLSKKEKETKNKRFISKKREEDNPNIHAPVKNTKNINKRYK